MTDSTPTPATKGKPKGKPVAWNVFLRQLADTHTDGDVTKMGKRVRRIIRDNYADVTKQWPALRKRDNRSGAPYPDVTPAARKAIKARLSK